MDKITLREIIKSVKEGARKDKMLINHRNFLYEIEENLKQLEERIEGIVAQQELNKKELFVSPLGVKLNKGISGLALKF